MKLRPYQQEAIDLVKEDLSEIGASIIDLPTGSGKSYVIAEIAKLVQPVLILQPSQELLKQNYEKLCLIVNPMEVGIYSASFNKRDTSHPYIFATIQSIYKVPELFKHVKLVIIDECHGVSTKDMDSMYRQFFAAIGNPKIYGLTATPYRLEIGYQWQRNWAGGNELVAVTMLKMIRHTRTKGEKDPITGKRGPGVMFWKRILYSVSHTALLEAGYLSPLEYIHEPLLPYEQIPVNASCSDYNLEAYAEAVVGREANILRTISEAKNRYKSVLVFCASTDQARRLNETMRGSGLVLAETDKKEREAAVNAFKTGAIRVIFNVGVLTTGFDHPSLDCVVLLRPTRSPLLYMQMLGRLTRTAPGKEKGTVIDLSDTCRKMGRIETFEMYEKRGKWDLRTEKHDSWRDRALFARAIAKK